MSEDRAQTRNDVGLVAIGRNEGERLRACLESVAGQTACMVYVDSGSTDGSVEMARGLGVEVVELDLSVPFTAARARNAGWRRLLEVQPDLQYVQFVDGDCAVQPGWIDRAHTHLAAHPKHAGVCGRRRERHPEASLYNRLCDMEWDTPPGIAKATGGDAMFRLEALREVAGFDEALICGEEPEMCYRMRRQGWQVETLDAEMTLHDADMHHLRQWWKRSQRSGWATAEGRMLYGGPDEPYHVRSYRSLFTWVVYLPMLLAGLTLVATLALGLPIWAVVLATILLPPLLTFGGQIVYGFRVGRARMRERGDPWAHARTFGIMTMLSKLPAFLGAMSFHWKRRRKQTPRLIEYK